MSDEDWNGGKQKAKEEKRKQEPQAQQKEEDLTKDNCPSSPVYDPTFKQDPLPCHTPTEMMALDPNYYPPGYIPDEQEKDDAPLLVNNVVNPLEKNTPEDPAEEEEEEKVSIKTQADQG